MDCPEGYLHVVTNKGENFESDVYINKDHIVKLIPVDDGTVNVHLANGEQINVFIPKRRRLSIQQGQTAEQLNAQLDEMGPMDRKRVLAELERIAKEDVK